MNTVEIGKRALSTIRGNKALWFFGFFVASSGAGGAGGRPGHGGGPVPIWVWLAVAAAVVCAGAFLILHVLSEAALIEGVVRQRSGERLGVGAGLRDARRHFFRLLGFKAGALGLAFLGVAVLAAPALAAALGVLPAALGIGISLVLAVPGVIALLTLALLYEYGMRAIVLEERTAGDAWRAARRRLSGHLVDGTQLLLLSFAGQLGGNALAFVAVLPGLGAGLIAYAFGGLPVAIALGALVALPFLVPVIGATASFRSSVWTLGYLEGREAR
ncbi:MAG: hypothetical protein KDH09_00450 [Chrysiogenetes bacterium]|nr:hypothetical protein [Chrysiogenetes bacterium]